MEVVACLPPFLSKHLLSVTPVIAVIPPRLAFTPNPQEASAGGRWRACGGAVAPCGLAPAQPTGQPAPVSPTPTFSAPSQQVAAVFTAPLRAFLEGGPGYEHRDVEWEGLPYR